MSFTCPYEPVGGKHEAKAHARHAILRERLCPCRFKSTATAHEKVPLLVLRHRVTEGESEGPVRRCGSCNAPLLNWETPAGE